MTNQETTRIARGYGFNRNEVEVSRRGRAGNANAKCPTYFPYSRWVVQW
ncbi:MAG: hypothetical protein RLO19_19410 [Coleofasciculus sp. G2-EDA-02]